MNIQERKIEFVQAFLQLENEELISRFEELLKSEKEPKIAPMSLDELNERIDKSVADSKNDSVTESAMLMSEIQQWN